MKLERLVATGLPGLFVVSTNHNFPTDQRPDRGYGLLWSWEFPVLRGLGPVQVRFFCSLSTELPSTIEGYFMSKEDLIGR